MPGFRELVFIAILIIVLSATGLWPVVMRGLRELRGERFDDEPGSSGADLDMCYRILGVSASARWDEIERAYKNKAKVHHPDKGGDGDTMRALNEAYSRLKKLRKH
jgi:DnaJ-domain-containing protein 1